MSEFHLPTDGSVLIVDDHQKEAMPLVQLLSSRGIPITYYTGVDPDHLPEHPKQKIRLAFFDIQLVPARNSNEYAQMILGLLERLVPADNGPFALVLWSKRLEAHAKEVKRQIVSNKNTRKPLCVIELEKSDYFTEVSDDVSHADKVQDIRDDLAPSFKPDDVDRIVETVEGRISVESRWEPKSDQSLSDIMKKLKEELADNIGCFELFTKWETQINQAAGQTVTSYSDLHNEEEHWSENIKYIIYRMAHAQAGKTVDDLDNKSLMQNALKTLNQTFLDDVENNISSMSNFSGALEIDKDAISFNSTIKKIPYKLKWRAKTEKYQFYKNGDLVPPSHPGINSIDALRKKVIAEFNRNDVDEDGIKAFEKVVKLYDSITPEINGKLHIDTNIDGGLRPGNVYKRNVRFVARRKVLLANYFRTGDKKANLFKLDGSCALNDHALRKIHFVELEVTPPCDFAQNKWLKSRVLPGVLIPETYFDQFEGASSKSFYGDTPIIKFGSVNHKILFDFRLFKSADRKHMEKLGDPLFRFRQEIHSDIISKLSNHVNRLGIAAVI